MAPRWLIALACLWIAAPAAAGGDTDPRDSIYYPVFPTRVTAGLGFDFNRGAFGADSTSDTVSLTPLVRIESDNVIVRAALPFFRLEGPIERGEQAPEDTEYGVGDLTLSMAYTLYPWIEGMPFLDLIGKVKFPTAGQDFGTGEFDVTLGLSATRLFYEKLVVFGDLGIRLRGGGLYHDTLLAAFGTGMLLDNGMGVWLAYDWREAPFAGRGDEHEITPFFSIPVAAHLRLDPYLLFGLSKASPDWGLGTIVSWKF